MLTVSYHLFGEMFFNYESLVNEDIETYIPLQKFVNQYGNKNMKTTIVVANYKIIFYKF